MKGFTLRWKSPPPYGDVKGKPFPTGILGKKTFPTRKEAEAFYASSLTADRGGVRFIGEVKV